MKRVGLPGIEPKPKRRMRQPTKDQLRARIGEMSEEIDALRSERDALAARREPVQRSVIDRLRNLLTNVSRS